MIINATNELKPFLNTVVGYIKVNESWVHHNNSFETAAWWEDSKIETGVYPLILTENYHQPKDLRLISKLKSIVVDDYFPALWGGVSVSNQPYVAKNIGQSRNVTKSFEILECMQMTGNSPCSKIDMCLNPFLWQAFINAARDSLESYRNIYNEYVKEYDDCGDGEYDTNLNMIAYSSEQMNKLVRGISEMKRCMKNMDNDYLFNLYGKNTDWIKLAA